MRPREAGRPAQTATLTLDKPSIDRAIAILPMLKGTVRDIRLGLELILGVKRSVGYISETLTAAGEQAATYYLESECRSRSWVRPTRSSRDGDRVSPW